MMELLAMKNPLLEPVFMDTVYRIQISGKR